VTLLPVYARWEPVPDVTRGELHSGLQTLVSVAEVVEAQEEETLKILAVAGALGLVVSSLWAQGLNPGNQTKDDWEEINFEFNSSVLSDGYPSLLRLAELLIQHRDYRVRVTGNTDDIGAAAFNERLGLARANAVRDFLIKYGAADSQITAASQGKATPAVSNTTREGRFINRRVTLLVTDAQGRTVKEGSIREVINAIPQVATPPGDCCNEVRRQLEKLDDILAALKNLQGENEKLRGELAELKNQQDTIRDQVSGLPKTIPAPVVQPAPPAGPSASDIANEIQRRNQKFSLLGVNVGPSYGPNRFGNGDFTVSGRAQFFSPFGDGTHAIQAQGEYMYYPGRQEGQFDIGLVERWNSLQVGAFGSFKGMTFREYQHPGFLAEGAFLADYIFSRGRIGGFATAGFKNDAVLNSTTLSPYEFLQTYAHVANQYGVNMLVGVWGNAYVQANAGYVRLRAADDMPGAMIKLVQPLNEKISFTLEAGLNETYLSASDKGRVVAGLEFGNYIRPKEYATVKTPVPMDVPRIRYQLLTRRVGNSPPVADAGPNQIGVAPGTITLNGSGSYDPDGGSLTYNWQQISGPSVTITNANAAVATFPASANQIYYFRLTVKDTAGLQASATTTVSTGAGTGVQITSFTGSPTNIQAGQTATLSWTVAGATSVSISPGIGSVNAQSGSTQVSPQQTTTYTLTATGPGGSVNATAVVSVGGGTPPQIVRFEASPLTIQPGQQSTLSWSTNGASQVAISSVGSVMANGSTNVSPQQTTTYTLTVTGTNGQTVTAPVTVTVAAGALPQVATFAATPSAITAGQSTQLCWKVTNATSISITPGVGTNLNANDCASVSPTQTTTYTLTAVNAAGQIQANATVTVGQVQILSFTASPATSSAAGAPVTLSWSTANATSVILTGADIPPQSLPVNGSLVVNPITNSTYTLTAYGPGGQTVSVTISVFVR
jgi:outer membrane protein OmpA-like peptidoglycan-associated protein